MVNRTEFCCFSKLQVFSSKRIWRRQNSEGPRLNFYDKCQMLFNPETSLNFTGDDVTSYNRSHTVHGQVRHKVLEINY